jgi:hypothetical protein
MKEIRKLRQFFEKIKKMRRRRNKAKAKKTDEAYKKENNMHWRCGDVAEGRRGKVVRPKQSVTQ